MAKLKDIFANILSGEVTSNGTTNVHQEIITGISLGKGIGMIIEQVQFAPSSTMLASMKADAEHFTAYFSVSDDVTETQLSLIMGNSKVICAASLYSSLNGTAGNIELIEPDIVRHFSPPIVVAAPRIYLGIVCTSGVSGDLAARMHFRYVELAAQEYLEIAETFVLVG